MKKLFIPVVLAAVLSAVILAYPSFYRKSIPAASPVTVEKIEYTDNVESDGVLLKNEENGVIFVQTNISEKDISKIYTGLVAEIRGDAFPDRVYSAKVTGIAGEADKIIVGNSVKTVVAVELEITNPDNTLKSGYTAQVKIISGTPREKRLLPYNSVIQDEGGEYVYVLKNSTAVKRYIITGDELPDGIEVVSGLSENEQVIRIETDTAEIGDEAVVSLNSGNSGN